MKPALYSLMAVVLCAIANVITERKLAQVSPIINTAILITVQVMILLPTVLLAPQFGFDFVWGEKGEWRFAIIIGLLYLFANLCFFSAYKNGISLATSTTLAILLPVFASFIKYAIGGGLPAKNQVAGWLLAIIAVWLIAKK